jgi:NADH:ubiquinone oxidoreductase subunit 6 (subunit J)
MTLSDPERPDPEKAARQRFFIIGLFRLSGAVIVMFGFLIMMQRFGWVQGQKAKTMGAIIAFVGLFQFMVVPRFLLRAWRTPPGR